MNSDERPIYGIGAVARMLELSATTIRNWEERYGGLRPARSDGGQRLYSREDLERLRFLRDEVAAGASPADAHRLLAERAEEGTGATFIPDADAPQLLILVAERDQYAAELVEYFLRTEGYAVELATTAPEVIDAFGSVRPDLVILELLLSGGAGVEVCRELKQHGHSCVLATSALHIEDAALAAGADAFLAKPFDSLTLVSTVKDLLNRSALLRPATKAPV